MSFFVQISCSAQRRRPKSGAHSLRRRRTLSARVDCRVDSSPHIFDKLPWISALDSSPEHLDPWDIADLSLISDSYSSDLPPPPGIGPVRRRKTSQRSSPLAKENDEHHNRGEELPWALPSRDNSFRYTPIPQTPFSRFNPSRVLFQHLMPVSCDSLPNNDSL